MISFSMNIEAGTELGSVNGTGFRIAGYAVFKKNDAGK